MRKERGREYLRETTLHNCAMWTLLLIVDTALYVEDELRIKGLEMFFVCWIQLEVFLFS